MANWANPTITSNYVTFVDEVKARDVDAITLQINALVNPPVSAIKLLRSPVKFQEWNGSAFIDLVLSVGGGGTGQTTIPGFVATLGLGTMAYQNANAVNITGGTLSGINITGNPTFNGGTFVFSSPSGATPVNIVGAAGQWTTFITAPNVGNASHGLLISAGTSKLDNALYVRNAATSITGFYIRGDMGVICPYGLVIPVGGNKFVPQ